MLDQTLIARIVAELNRAGAATGKFRGATAIAGGSINQAYRFDFEGHRCFIKVNHAKYAAMFDAEATALNALSEATDLTIPAPITYGSDSESAWLAMQWLDLVGFSRNTEVALGRGLAQLHRHTSLQFGFGSDNWLGLTAQPNTQRRDWISFFREHRLLHQLKIAAKRSGANSLIVSLGERLAAHIDDFFVGYTPQASLLHGDLWNGNAGATRDGAAAIFDPASYFGDRETDIAMTQLFGGFGASFYAAYQEAWPLDRGFPVRRDLYNLYHVLNHFNLFGGSYGDQAAAIMQGLLAEV